MSFALHWIRAEIHEYVLRNWRLVKVATTKAQRKLFFNLRSMKTGPGALTRKEATAIAKDLGVKTEEVFEMETRLSGRDVALEPQPGDESEIQSFCTLNYQVNFPLFAKIEVNGRNTHPLYRELKAASPGILGTQGVKWNFTKFLLDARGRVIKRYAPTTKPEHLSAEIAALLDQQSA